MKTFFNSKILILIFLLKNKINGNKIENNNIILFIIINNDNRKQSENLLLLETLKFLIISDINKNINK